MTLLPEVETRYDLLVCDVNGTLVGEDKVVPRGVIDAVKAAQRAGAHVRLATERMWGSTRPFVEVLRADPPVILYNGGLVFDFASRRSLVGPADPPRERRLDPAYAPAVPADLPSAVRARKGVRGTEHPPCGSLCPPGSGDGRVTPRFEPLLTEGPMKFLVGDPAALDALSRALGEIHPPVNRVSSQRDYLEILPQGVSKGAALPVLARAAGVPLERVVAVGDALNDVTMLEAAGMGIAVEGSPQELRAVADWVCPPPEQEGVRVVIERIFLSLSV